MVTVLAVLVIQQLALSIVTSSGLVMWPLSNSDLQKQNMVRTGQGQDFNHSIFGYVLGVPFQPSHGYLKNHQTKETTLMKVLHSSIFI